MLLLRHDPAATETLDSAVWREWSPIVAAFPAAHGAASWDDKRVLLTCAAIAASDEVFAALTRLIEAASDVGKTLSPDRELELVWSPRLSAWIRDALTAGRLAGNTATDFARVLSKRDPDTARPRTSIDADRQSFEGRPREQTHSDLVRSARASAADGYDIRVVALDISYARPPA